MKLNQGIYKHGHWHLVTTTTTEVNFIKFKSYTFSDLKKLLLT